MKDINFNTLFKIIKINFFLLSVFLFFKINLIHYNGVIILNIKKDISNDINFILNSNIKNANEIIEFEPFVIHDIKNLNYHGEGFDLFGINQKTNNYKLNKIAEKKLSNDINGIEGIFSFYYGYSFISGENGKIIFPNIQNENKINIYITEEIIPIKTSGKVPNNFKLKKNIPVKLYECSINKDNEKNEKIISIKEMQINSEDKIPFNSIIIFFNPNKVYFSNNSIRIKSSENIIIPDLILKDFEDNYIERIALNTLNYLNYHEPISTLNATYYTKNTQNQDPNSPTQPIDENVAEKHKAIFFKKNS